MTDEELIARLREVPFNGFTAEGQDGVEDPTLCCSAADRIEQLVATNEALVKERDEALEWLSASQGYIADAVFALDKQEKAEARAERLEGDLKTVLDRESAAYARHDAKVERLEAAIRELQHRWYLGDLTEKDFSTALEGDSK